MFSNRDPCVFFQASAHSRSIVLECQPGVDAAGYSGLQDEAGNHWGVFNAVLLSILLGGGCELGSTNGTGSNSDVITALRRGSSDSLNQDRTESCSEESQHLADTDVRSGFLVRAILNRDFMLEPYKGVGDAHGEA